MQEDLLSLGVEALLRRRRGWAQVSFLHGRCKNNLSIVCPAWPDSPAGQGLESDPDQTDEEVDPGECMLSKKIEQCSLK